MAHPIASTVDDLKPSDEKVSGFSNEAIPVGILQATEVNAGMVTSRPDSKVPPGAAELIVNGRVKLGWTETKPGTTLLTPSKPDSNKIYKLILALNIDGQPVIVRFALGSIQLLINGTWVSVTDFITLTPYETAKNINNWWLFTAGITNGKTYDKHLPDNNQLLDGTPALNAAQVIAKEFQGNLLIVPAEKVYHPTLDTTQMFNYLFVADDVGPIGYIELSNQIVDDRPVSGRIIGSPPARHITTFGDRLVTAHVTDDSGTEFPERVQWSDNVLPFSWDGETSGFEDLIQGAQGFGDHITGIFGFDRECTVLRMNSLWMMSRQAFASSPFRFDPYVAGFGCDLPYSTAEIENGIMYADRRTRGIYHFSLGQLPIRVSSDIDNLLFDDLKDPIWVEGGYDPYRRIYRLGITTSGTDYLLQKIYLFDLATKTWATDSTPVVSCFGKMGGTECNQLRLVYSSSMFEGTQTGEIVYENESVATEWDGTALILTFMSPNVGDPSKRRTLKNLLARMLIQANGTVKFEVSNDKVTWRNGITETVTASNAKTNHGLRKQQITGDDIYWRLTATGRVQLHQWFTRLLEKSIQR